MSAKTLERVPLRHIILSILERYDCEMDRKLLKIKVASEVCTEYSLPEGESCLKEVARRVQTSLRDAKDARILVIEDGKVIYPLCKHRREVIRGLDLLLHTLNFIEHLPHKDFAIRGCDDYLDYLRRQGFAVRDLIDVAEILKSALEHFVTAVPTAGEGLGFLYNNITFIIRSKIVEEYVLHPNSISAKRGQAYVEFRNQVKEFMDRVGIGVMGCCRKCIKMEICREGGVGSDVVDMVERVVAALLKVSCYWE
jgi:hypothetical protein